MKNLITLPIYCMLLTLLSCHHAEVHPKVKPVSFTDTSTTVNKLPPSTGCTPLVTNFIAGQHTIAGTVSVTNDSINLYVTLSTKDGWLMTETQVYAGSKSGLPQTPTGNPKIGNFPYKSSNSPAVNTYTYTIPLSTLPKQGCIIIAAHAAVEKVDSSGAIVDQQTAWGAGSQCNGGGSWATYIDYCFCKSNVPVGGTVTPGNVNVGGN